MMINISIIINWIKKILTIKYDWHPWFAWRPVLTMDGRLVWLKTVDRRYAHEGCFDESTIYKWVYYQRKIDG